MLADERAHGGIWGGHRQGNAAQRGTAAQRQLCPASDRRHGGSCSPPPHHAHPRTKGLTRTRVMTQALVHGRCRVPQPPHASHETGQAQQITTPSGPIPHTPCRGGPYPLLSQAKTCQNALVVLVVHWWSTHVYLLIPLLYMHRTGFEADGNLVCVYNRTHHAFARILIGYFAS
jgi:hypothetical protein